MTHLNTLSAISPIDGRYQEKTRELQPYFSEYGLFKYRLLVEIFWYIALADETLIEEVPALTLEQRTALLDLIKKFSVEDAAAIKEIEKTTNHDVKAVEYFLKEKFDAIAGLENYKEFIHFACTSEDINNLAYAMMLQHSRQKVFLPTLNELLNVLREFTERYADVAILGRTHGQAATPSTVGKEIANFIRRLEREVNTIKKAAIRAKINGAVGNYNAHQIAYPNIDWPGFSQRFVEQFGLEWNNYTTQIENHDYIAEYFDSIARFNSILVDFNRDIWGYISLNYFTQKTKAHEVGSSTMPHKVNPIDFENSEGNALFANAILKFLSGQLTLSRFQRDLVDSTLLRNLGIGIAHSLIAYQSTIKGIKKLEVNHTVIQHDLNQHWDVLAEAVQTVMRRHGIEQPYEKLKDLTRGKTITEEALKTFISNLDLPTAVKQELLNLRPETYLGYATSLAKKV